MTSPNDIVMGQSQDPGDFQTHQPFTAEENIDHLNAIGRSIAQLMSHTATALNALTTPASAEPVADGANQPALDPPSQKEAFRSATDSFLTTLHSIDVRMKRQVLALEEAGIVNLSNAPRQGPNSAAAKASLKPNGVGTVGNLDVGWLNSRSWRVERDMEAELWQEARDFLEKHDESLKMS
ncbi:mediator complex protein [Hirsutella rhossiliensis]|uniref:Mediator of RNA polymerase II transcription subunit 11 n=1 Tax=Hirsutella rhossiliensis TaxID=111463 RepID=A0A9P8MZ57_9HYPO|nr:mediator complex protein [Hirsutella rhossiliensis]KAH0963667.1 mediator complex protein [Hirsutella rhossiliensis]